MEEYKENDLNKIEINIQDVYYGWYSNKQKYSLIHNNKKKNPISNIYMTPNGDEVEVTMVSKSNNKYDFNFDDIIFKGIVTEWKRSIYY